MPSNVDELAQMAEIVASTGAHIWEVFLLVQMGCGGRIVFVAYDGELYPAGFMPEPLGNVEDHPLLV